MHLGLAPVETEAVLPATAEANASSWPFLHGPRRRPARTRRMHVAFAPGYESPPRDPGAGGWPGLCSHIRVPGAGLLLRLLLLAAFSTLQADPSGRSPRRRGQVCGLAAQAVPGEGQCSGGSGGRGAISGCGCGCLAGPLGAGSGGESLVPQTGPRTRY